MDINGYENDIMKDLLLLSLYLSSELASYYTGPAENVATTQALPTNSCH